MLLELNGKGQELSLELSFCGFIYNMVGLGRGAWVALLVQCLPLAQVRIQAPGIESIRLLALLRACFTLCLLLPMACALFLSLDR